MFDFAGKLPLTLGQVVATPLAIDAISEAMVHPLGLLIQHAMGDWGDVPKEDWELNNLAVMYGDRVLSAYTLPTGVKVWIITEADRSVTTILLPEEY